MRMSNRLSAGFAAAVLSLSAPAANALTFTFDADADGWLLAGQGAMSWVATGGNGGGHLQISDVGNDDFELIAPLASIGSLSAFLGGTLSFDARNIDGATADYSGFGEIRIASTGQPTDLVLDIIPLGQPAVGADWTRYTIPLTVAVWGSSLPTYLAGATTFAIKPEFHNGQPELVGVDNITLAPVPEPGEWALLLGGLAAVATATRRRKVPA